MFLFGIWMIDKLEERFINDKTPGLNNPETYVLTHNRFNTYLLSNFSGLHKAQIWKMPNRDSPRHGIEIVMSFN